MNGLWADGWFYISSAGLLVSGVLFFFLLGQYRAAADAEDGTQVAAEPEIVISAVRPIYIPDEPAPAPKKVASAPAEVLAEAPKAEPPIPAPAFAGPERRRENATGGISPAVVYLQNIKVQLEGLHGQVAELAKRVESVTSRDEMLIERLGDLAQAVEALKSEAPAAVPAVEPEQPVKRARKPVPEKAAEPAPVVVAPAPAVEPAPMNLELGAPPAAQVVKADASAPDATVRLEPGDILKTVESAPAPGATAEAPAEEKPARRGPVWPV